MQYRVEAISPDNKECKQLGRWYAFNETDAEEMAKRENPQLEDWWIQAFPCIWGV
jgi:hypothetical protein